MKWAGVIVVLGLLFASGLLLAEGRDGFMEKREAMVKHQIEDRGVRDPGVLEAMRKVERHLFVPAASRMWAYNDGPLPIGHGQTISQPYIVAYMTEAARLDKDDKVLEIGTGSGYQAAILGEIADKVYTIEIVEPLAKSAAERLEELGYGNVHVKHGDGYKGWPQHAPFDAIIVTAAPEDVPQALADQLKAGGRMVIPVGSVYQELLVITKTESGLERESVFPVRFVPMIREGENE